AGPPCATYSSRRKRTQPAPPLPERQVMRARSISMDALPWLGYLCARFAQRAQQAARAGQLAQRQLEIAADVEREPARQVPDRDARADARGTARRRHFELVSG